MKKMVDSANVLLLNHLNGLDDRGIMPIETQKVLFFIVYIDAILKTFGCLAPKSGKTR